jgi:hypothetical protein
LSQLPHLSDKKMLSDAVADRKELNQRLLSSRTAHRLSSLADIASPGPPFAEFLRTLQPPGLNSTSGPVDNTL